MQDPDRCELLTRLRAAEDAVRARDDFLALAAHELRSPLNALALRLATLERMAARGGDAGLRLELQRARRSVDRYVRRAVVLLDLSRLHAGGLQPAREWVGIGEVVRNVVDAYRDEAEFYRTTLQDEVLEDAAGHWDPHMVEQILANLVSNAIKYGGGTPVRLRAGLGPAGQAWFEVADSGPGIPPESRQRIFEKFERVVTDARERSGFGLGLWIVGRMVAAHGGGIEVTAPAGGGSVFRVTLPLAAAADDNDEEEQRT